MNQMQSVALPVEQRRSFRMPPANRALAFLGVLLFLVILGQAAIVVQARPQDLISGAHGMADILRRSFPPDFSKIGETFEPALHFRTFDEFMDFAYRGGWLTPFLEALGLHKANAMTRLMLNLFFFPVQDHHSIEIVLAQKVKK